MRAPAVLAAIALAGTVLLGGAGQALAYDNDDTSAFGIDLGKTPPAASDFGKGSPGFDQTASASDKGTLGFDKGTSGSDQGASGSDQDASDFSQDASPSDQSAAGFSQAGSLFDQPTGR